MTPLTKIGLIATLLFCSAIAAYDLHNWLRHRNVRRADRAQRRYMRRLARTAHSVARTTNANANTDEN